MITLPFARDDRTLPDSIHALLLGIGGAECLPGKMERCGRKVAWLLEQGHDPNELNDKGLSPIEVVVREQLGDTPHEAEMVTHLVDALLAAGANPLNGQRASLKYNKFETLMIIAQAVIKREKEGYPLRSEDGGNLIHVLGEESPDYMGLVMSRRLSDNYPECNFPEAWITEKRTSDGATPVLAMLKRFSQLNDIDQINFDQQTNTEMQYDWVMSGACHFRKFEDDLFLEPDNQGVHACHVITELVGRGMPIAPVFNRLLNSLLVLGSQHALENNTANVTRKTNKPSRI